MLNVGVCELVKAFYGGAPLEFCKDCVGHPVVIIFQKVVIVGTSPRASKRNALPHLVSEKDHRGRILLIETFGHSLSRKLIGMWWKETAVVYGPLD